MGRTLLFGPMFGVVERSLGAGSIGYMI